jgi:DNA-binding CsgD family transcriptional regulator
MKKIDQPADAVVKKKQKRIEQAEARTEQAESRAEQAKTRTELAETRTEQAETRTEMAKTRTEQAEIRAEQAETRAEQAQMALERVVSNKVELRPGISKPLLKNITAHGINGDKNLLGALTARQSQILQLIVEGQNTKQIADTLKISPKTVEYHRLKLMDCLGIHDIPGLVRLALQAGLLSQEKPVAS